MLTEPPSAKLPFRNGRSGASVQHFVPSLLGYEYEDLTNPCEGKGHVLA